MKHVHGRNMSLLFACIIYYQRPNTNGTNGKRIRLLLVCLTVAVVDVHNANGVPGTIHNGMLNQRSWLFSACPERLILALWLSSSIVIICRIIIISESRSSLRLSRVRHFFAENEAIKLLLSPNLHVFRVTLSPIRTTLVSFYL